MKKHDLDIIYEQLKDRFDLTLTNTFALNDGYTIDVKVLCGTSSLGTFHLYKECEYDDWDEFVFSVTFPKPRLRLLYPLVAEKHTHWHPQTIEEATNDVIAFMDGTHKFVAYYK